MCINLVEIERPVPLAQPPLSCLDYTAEVLRTSVGEDTWVDKLTLGALGLAGEAGEVVDAIKKWSDSATPARSGGAAAGTRGCALVPGAHRQHL
jgi:hypothetical protein